MALEFLLPDIGEGLAEATVVRWLIAEGGAVGTDEPMVELETDKAVVEIPAPRAGVVLRHGAAAGQVIAVDELLVVIGDAGEEWVPGTAAAPAEDETAAPIVGTLEEAFAPEVSVLVPPPIGPTAPLEAADSVEALPLVRRLAAGLGVDVAEVKGTGPGGRVTRADVEAAAGRSQGERARMSPTRRAIADNLARSWREIPHVTTFAEAAAEGALAERSRLAATGSPVPLEAILIHAIAPLLAEYREFNAAVDGDEIVYKEVRDIGFAVDTPGGLMVAVLRTADQLDVGGLATEIIRLAQAARERKIAASELRGATFTVSNIGAVGGGYGTPIIPYGTSAILSVGRADERPMVRSQMVTTARTFPLSLSYDHRLIDGALGRAFLAAVVEAIEARA